MRFYRAVIFIASFACWASVISNAREGAADGNSPAKAAVARLPIMFESNLEPLAPKGSFLARGQGYSLLLTQHEIALLLQPDRARSRSGKQPGRISMELVGADEKCEPQGLEDLPGKTNYFLGRDPEKWRVGVSMHAKVKYENVYPGIDLIFYGTGRQLEYDLVLHAGADPNRIHFAVKGVSDAILEPDGALSLKSAIGTIRFKAPEVYQDDFGTPKRVEGQFHIASSENGSRDLSFVLGAYDRSHTLTIDPVLDYSTYLGGSGDDWAGSVAVDSTGNAYLVGTTTSLDFPVTPNAVFPNHDVCNVSCYDAFIAKISATNGRLEYATYLGGGGEDFGVGIAVDATGNAYVTGATTSTDFPTTGNALQRSCGGTCFYNDAFVTKLNSTGSALLYSTYLGGMGEDFASSIAVLNNNAFVSGFSASPDFPVTPGAYQTNMQGQGSSFVVEMNSTGTAEVFGTFLGEVDLQDAGGGIALDSAGNSYVAGNTLSNNFPLTAGAFHTSFLPFPASNAYILKLNPTGSALAYAASVGGASPSGIAVDPAGNAYVSASAGPFSPVTPGALDQACNNGTLLFKLNAKGTALVTAAHVCPDRLYPAGVGFDSSQNIIFSGNTDSTDLSTTVGSLSPTKTSPCCFSDIVLGKITADGSAINYLTYFGGNDGDATEGFAQGSSGNIYLAGYTNSSNFPLRNGLQKNYAGSSDAFLSVFTLPVSNLSVSPAAITFPAQGLGEPSQPVIVTIANLAASTLSISSAIASADFGVLSDNCGTELSPGTHCQISVNFNPSASGNRNGSLTITDGAGVQTVRLSGSAVTGPFLTFPSAYEIDTASNVTSPPFPVIITNTGNQTLNISQISLDNGPAFSFYGNTNCFRPIPPLGSCTVGVTFTGYGYFDYATLSFTDNATGSPQSFGLLGNVVGSGLIFTSPTLRFGQEVVNTASAAHQVTLLNGTSVPVTINSIKSSGAFPQTNNCGTTLAAGAYCYVKVRFKPTSTGIKQGEVTVNSSAAGTSLILPLLGTGN